MEKLNDDLSQMRSELADTYLNGNRDFTTEDLNVYAGVADTADIKEADGD